MNLRDIRRLVRVSIQDADLVGAILDEHDSMLSPPERAVLYQLLRLVAPADARVAELGTYLGGTTRLFGEAFRRAGIGDEARIEVYDFFEHNKESSRRLREHPLYDERDFFAIWQANTQPYADLVELRRGDLREVSAEGPPLWMLFVDIVKSDFLINPVMQRFLPRLSVGGLLVHQDYFHWQSPWVVYATERIMDHLELVGSVSNHTMILRVREEIPAELLELDYLTGLDWTDKDLLMQRAIDRFEGVRAGLLRISRLNLISTEGLELPAEEIRELREQFAGSTRLQQYLSGVLRWHESEAPRAVW